MPATASIEDLKEVDIKLKEIEQAYPEAYKAFGALFKNHRKVGYKNICKLLLDEATPEKLKGIG